MPRLNLKDKWILSLDVSVPLGQITFLNCNDASSTTTTLDENQKISVTLLPLIQNTIKKLKLNTENLCAIGFSTGPGSYMNLRIGISTAKGLSMSLGCPILGFSSLEILAEDAIRKYSVNSDFIPHSLISIRNADKDNIFSAIFQISRKKDESGYFCTRKTDDKLIAFSELKIQEYQNTILICSSMEKEKMDSLEKKHGNILLLPIDTSSLAVGLLTLDRIKADNFSKINNLLPTYCRDVKLG